MQVVDHGRLYLLLVLRQDGQGLALWHHRHHGRSGGGGLHQDFQGQELGLGCSVKSKSPTCGPYYKCYEVREAVGYRDASRQKNEGIKDVPTNLRLVRICRRICNHSHNFDKWLLFVVPHLIVVAKNLQSKWSTSHLEQSSQACCYFKLLNFVNKQTWIVRGWRHITTL